MNIFIGIFILLHGLVHIWYVTLSQRWVEFQVDMGWTGKSWLLTNLLGDQVTRFLATLLYSLSAIVFVAAGVGLLANQEWSRPGLVIASIISSLTILVFWDGSLNMPVEKGLLGLLISVGILIAVFVFRWSVT
ncbi:MAG: hypothetical protein WBL25_10280 [Anaerolineales bacterium]